MPPATDLSIDKIREIIDHAHSEYMSKLPPVERPTPAELQESESIYAESSAGK
ncbi:hypothetical protein [Oleiharenicola lentus]|uniref:hypothetical protein n=1 Tax=Oleiharenicola lentus TaxID=2508720 RepID=UPI003F661D23